MVTLLMVMATACVFMAMLMLMLILMCMLMLGVVMMAVLVLVVTARMMSMVLVTAMHAVMMPRVRFNVHCHIVRAQAHGVTVFLRCSQVLGTMRCVTQLV